MPGIWLGENTVPELTKIKEGVLRFSHGTDRTLWPGILIVGVIGIPCIVVCTFLAIYGEGPINPVIIRFVLFAFSVTVVSAISYACWVAVASLIETGSRTIVREYYFLGSRFWSKELQIHDGDYLAIVTGDDEHGTGAFHYIYVCRTKPLFLFSAIHLPSTTPSDTLMKAVDDIAQTLLVENRGYIGWHGILSAWSRFITRRT